MEYALAALAGWCGTGWPIRFPGTGGGGGWDPDQPWPDNCPPCGLVIGAISGVIIWAVLGRDMAADGGVFAIAGLGFLGGSFGLSLVRSLTSLGGRGKPSN